MSLGVTSVAECPSFPSIPGVEFKHCDGLPGIAVTNTGTACSCRAGGRDHRNNTKPWRQLKGSRGAGYVLIMTVIDGRPTGKYLHRLVLEAFVGPCPPGLECRHLDGNKLNCRLDNLAWGTSKENKADSIRLGRIHAPVGETSGMAKLTDVQIREILTTPELTANAAARKFNISTRYVYQLRSGERRTVTTQKESW